MNIVKLYAPCEESIDFNRESLFEKDFITPREQRIKMEELLNNKKDVEIKTLNEYVVACILVNCIGNKNIELKVFKEDLSTEKYIEIELDECLYWSKDGVYSCMKDMCSLIMNKRLGILEEKEVL